MFKALKFTGSGGCFTKSAKRLGFASAMSVLGFGFLVSSFGAADTAYVPFEVNAAAKVKAAPAGDGYTVSIDVAANQETVLKIPLTAMSIKEAGRSALNNAPLVSNARGKVSLNLPASSYKNAEVALYTVNGRAVMRGGVSASDAVKSISRSNVVAGVYLLSVKGANGNSFSSRMTHRGGALNINVAFDGNGGIAGKDVKTAAGEFPYRITVTSLGYNDYEYDLNVMVGTNTKQKITLQAAAVVGQSVVTFDPNGGNVSEVNDVTNPYGKLESLPIPTRNGYDFDGWYTTPVTGGSAVDKNTVYKANITLYARWTLIAYTITFNASGGSVTPASATTDSTATLASLPTPTRSGYLFTGWYVTGVGKVSKSTVFSGNTTISAGWISNSFTDTRDDGVVNNRTYRIASIGNQIWMAENLNFVTPGSRCYESGIPTDTTDYCAKYGRLYTWVSAMAVDDIYSTTKWEDDGENHRGVCPVGWHLPSDPDWDSLMIAVGGVPDNYNGYWEGGTWYDVATVLKSQTGWYYSGTNEYGFSALPGGYYRYSVGDFVGAGGHGYWWSASGGEDYALSISMSGNSKDVSADWVYKTGMYSVRCVRD